MTPVILDNGTLRVTITPGLGGTITSLCHLPTGTEVLARTPWRTETEPLSFAPDEAAWLTRFSGGWLVMFPNAGDACDDGPSQHGFHGEASVSRWQAKHNDGDLVLTRRLQAVPVTMTRHMTLVANRLKLVETITTKGPCTVAWGQHVTLGSNLLDGVTTLATSASGLLACNSFTPLASPLEPGTIGDWPILPGRQGPVDLTHPPDGVALLACLTDLGPEPWASLTRADGLSVRLDWTADPWPLAWLWIETGGSTDLPWNGQARMIAVEPCTTWPATGLAAARAAGGRLISLAAGETRQARITLTIHAPEH